MLLPFFVSPILTPAAKEAAFSKSELVAKTRVTVARATAQLAA